MSWNLAKTILVCAALAITACGKKKANNNGAQAAAAGTEIKNSVKGSFEISLDAADATKGRVLNASTDNKPEKPAEAGKVPGCDMQGNFPKTNDDIEVAINGKELKLSNKGTEIIKAENSGTPGTGNTQAKLAGSWKQAPVADAAKKQTDTTTLTIVKKGDDGKSVEVKWEKSCVQKVAPAAVQNGKRKKK